MDLQETKTCDCCCERPIGGLGRQHGHDLCDDCCLTTTCDRDGCTYVAEPHYIWEPGLCERCAEREARWSWIDETISAIESEASENGWDEDRDQQAQTGTRYLTFSRGDETLVIRVADHGDCYCRSDYSVAMPGHESGDDHSLRQVLDRLARPAVETD